MLCKCYNIDMSTYLYKALISAGAEENKATDAAKEIDNYRGDITELKSDVKALKARMDVLIIGVGLLVALGIFDKFFL